MTSVSTSLIVVVAALGLAACSEKRSEKRSEEVYTLYTSDVSLVDNSSPASGRNGVATFELANNPELQGQICREYAEVLQEGFEREKLAKGWQRNVRYWCEKGRFKK